jgi:peptidoglycan/LPS O-acetylase OafA/YrhL
VTEENAMKSQAVSQSTASAAGGSGRLYYLDWLRVLAILTVFVYHSTRFFNLEDWHVKNTVTYGWLEVWNRAAVIWMMPLIFVISGASLFFVVGRGGAGKFVKDKVLRLLVPLLAADVTHCSLQVYLERLTHGQFSGTYLQFLPQYFTGIYDGDNPASGNFALTGMHLWYLFWLFLFSLLLYPLLSWLKGRGRRVLGKIGDLLAIPGVVYVLVIPTVLLLVFASPNGLVMDLEEAGWSLFIYLWLLFCGFLLVSSGRVQAGILRLRWISLTIGAASSVAYLWLSFQPGAFSSGDLPYALFVGLRGLGSWCLVLASLGLGMRYLNTSTPFVRYANEAVLPFYIMHQTVLLCVGYFVVQWAISDVLKWLIILLASFGIIMALYEFLVRRFNVLRVLFGMKPIAKQPIAQTGKALQTG